MPVKRWLINCTISLLIGGAFLWLAMRDWNWTDISESLQSFDGGRAWISIQLAPGQAPPESVRLTHLLETPRSADIALSVHAGPGGRLLSAPLPPALAGDADGWWSLTTDDAQRISSWSLAFRAPEARAMRSSRGDPLVFRARVGPQGPSDRIRVTSVAWAWLLPYVLIFFFVHFSRVYRWGILLQPLVKLRPARLYAVGSVGFLAILLLPLRLGEFVRPYLVTEDGASFSGALGTCVVERVIDGLAVTLVLFASIFLAAATGTQIPLAIYLAGLAALAVFAGALTVLLLARWKRAITVATLQKLFGLVSKGLATRLTGLLSSFLDGLNALPNRRDLLIILSLTVTYWFVNAVGFWCMFRATGLTLPDGSDLSLLHAFVVMSILAIGIIIPAGPGFAGNFEAAMRLGLSLFLVEEVLVTRGAAYIILLHALQFILQCGIGFAFLMTGQISFRRAVTDSAEAASQLPR